jgi:leader peptidase (prepilin peptidase)/N-methyltransferase
LEPTTFFAVAAFIFGLLFGSFLNVCIYRMPRALSVVAPRSACPGCNTPIAAYDNIPVISWLVLGGKCRHCKRPISPRYIAVEILTGLLFLACVLYFGPNLLALKYIVFSFLLLGLIFTDCENRLLPDLLTLPGFFIGMAFSVVVPIAGPISYAFRDRADWHLLSACDALLAAVIGGAFIWLAGELYFRLRGMRGMGFGDVKLLLMIGAFVGLRLMLLTVFFASLSAAVLGLLLFWPLWRKRQNSPSMRRRYPDEKERKEEAYYSAMAVLRLPFGSFLGGAALVATFFGNVVVNWYIQSFF